jgi:hypothetical protein
MLEMLFICSLAIYAMDRREQKSNHYLHSEDSYHRFHAVM